MYHLQKTTLAYLKSRPLFQKIESKSARLRNVVAALNQYMTNAQEVSVEECALLFYMGNHFFSLLCQRHDPNEPLPPPVFEQAQWYVDTATNIARRCYYYTLMISTRETRHMGQVDWFDKTLKTKYGQEYVNFLYSLKGSSDHAVERLRHYTPDLSMAAYSNAVVQVFLEGKFGSSFGGKPWANIATNLLKVVEGEVSLETFTDTAWTLAHNNGPMFNKGMLFLHHTDTLIKLLDVQRSGQIPQLVCQSTGTTKKAVHGMTPEVIDRWRHLHSIIGDEFAGTVDWNAVQKAGAVGNYSSEVQVQNKTLGKDVLWVTESEYATISKRKAA